MAVSLMGTVCPRTLVPHEAEWGSNLCEAALIPEHLDVWYVQFQPAEEVEQQGRIPLLSPQTRLWQDHTQGIGCLKAQLAVKFSISSQGHQFGGQAQHPLERKGTSPTKHWGFQRALPSSLPSTTPLHPAGS